MDDLRLLSAIEAAEESAYGQLNDELSNDRQKAINAYLGHPYGDEVEGQSQIVSRDTMDTIEWIKPSLVRIFTGGDEIVRFDPVGPEDEELAEQESDYVNHIVQVKNPWFDIFLTWISDALLTKNAYAMAYWDEKEDTTKERYPQVTEDQLALMLQDPNIEISAAQSSEVITEQGPQTIYDVTLQETKSYGCVKIVVLPPERCLVAQSTSGVSVRDADFFEYWEMKSISDLRSMGFEVDDDINDDGGVDFSLEDSARDQFSERSTLINEEASEPSMRKVRVRVAFIKYDYNEDGLAEHIQVTVVGKTILQKKDDKENGVYEVSGVPVACIVPTPLAHRHPGMSVADMVMDIQYIKTMVQRQVLNNLYLSNNPRTGISDKVNLDDMLTSRVGGVVRVDGMPSQHMMPLVVPFVGPQALGIIEYLDQVKENRTGTNRYFSGTDEGSLNKTATGIAQLTSSAAQRVEMIARIFAEGVKDLFQMVHEQTLKHARKEEVVRLRNKWVTVDPRSWKKRQDMTIAVGLGTGNKEVVGANLGKIFQAQMATLPVGISTKEGIRKTVMEMTKAFGFPSPDAFWPESQEQSMDPAKMQEAMQQMQKQAQALEQEKQKLEQGKQAIQQEASKLEIEKIAFDADKEVEGVKAQYREAKIGMKAREAKVSETDGEVQTTDEKMQQAVDTLSQYAQGIAEIAQRMTAPKRIVRDASGKAVGVEQAGVTQQIVRGPDGRAVGIG